MTTTKGKKSAHGFQDFSTKTFKDIPRDLQAEFKGQCALSRITERDGIIQAMTFQIQYLKKARVQGRKEPAPLKTSADTNEIMDQLKKAPQKKGFLEMPRPEASGTSKASDIPAPSSPHPAITRDSLPGEQPITKDAQAEDAQEEVGGPPEEEYSHETPEDPDVFEAIRNSRGDQEIPAPGDSPSIPPEQDPSHPDYIPPPAIWKDLSAIERLRYKPAIDRKAAKEKEAARVLLTPEERAELDRQEEEEREALRKDLLDEEAAAKEREDKEEAEIQERLDAEGLKEREV